MQPTCRLCDSKLTQSVVDLGKTPLANSYIRPSDAEEVEKWFPLHVQVCDACWLVQIPEMETPEAIFRDYAYFSSFSDSWVEHARRYVDSISKKLSLGTDSFVVELASNDGYLLRHFISKNIPCLGVEPAQNVALAAIKAGIPTVSEFFDPKMALRFRNANQSADLIIANNVLAQVPKLRDFCRAIRDVLKADGVVTAEFPHLLKTLEKNEFDTVYHEHFSYFSLQSVSFAFETAGIRIFDVEELSTHGGSLRVYGCRQESRQHPPTAHVAALLEVERSSGLTSLETYATFHQRVQSVKEGLVRFLDKARAEGKTVAAYGAPAKGNTLLNTCGIKADVLQYTVDKNPHKQGCLLPGSRIPVFSPERIAETRPDYLLILPWNLADEIMQQCAFVRDWGGQFVVPIPEVTVL